MSRAIFFFLIVAAVGGALRASEPLPMTGEATDFATPAPLASNGIDPVAWQTGAVIDSAAPEHNPWYGGVEFGLTRFVHKNGVFALVDNEIGGSLRASLGYQGLRGLGVRSSLFVAGADSQAVLLSDSSLVDVDISALTFEIDFYRELNFDDFQLLLGVGSQAGVYAFHYEDDDSDRWGAGGPSLFAEGRQLLRVTPCSEWSIVGGGRVGYLLGEASYNSPPGLDDVGTALVLGRAFLALDYRRHFARGDLMLRLNGETQIWDTSEIGYLGLDTTGVQVGASW